MSNTNTADTTEMDSTQLRQRLMVLPQNRRARLVVAALLGVGFATQIAAPASVTYPTATTVAAVAAVLYCTWFLMLPPDGETGE
jgi:hypothetical protein